MAWVIGIYLAPYVMMMVAGALRSMDPSLEEAARVSGLDGVRTAARITLPLIAPAILSGAVLSFTIAIGLFGTPVVLGWAKQILLLTSRIWISSQAVPPDYGAMAILAIYLIALSLIANGLQRWLLAGRSFVTVTGKGFRPQPSRSAGTRSLPRPCRSLSPADRGRAAHRFCLRHACRPTRGLGVSPSTMSRRLPVRPMSGIR